MNGPKSSGDNHNASDKSQTTTTGPLSKNVLPDRTRMNDLPDEIVHITQGFIPLSLLLTRLAQTSHNALQDEIAKLAKMPLPAAALNGNGGHSAADDNSNENLRKKTSLLNFAQEQHAKWVKALVITEWSRKAEAVSKLIDLKFHIDQQRILFDTALDNMASVKRDLSFARLPSPDLKTALQVLSTGTAPWLSDVSLCRWIFAIASVLTIFHSSSTSPCQL
jgi:mediator of RNA polymerase II transcription subunit 14